MPKPISIGRVGRNLLLSVAVGTLPLAGCVNGVGHPTSDRQVLRASTQAEKSAYLSARSTSNPGEVGIFLCDYPRSELIRSLLTSIPPSDLQRVDPSCVRRVAPEVLETLPTSVRRQLGLLTATPAVVRSNSVLDRDGYSG